MIKFRADNQDQGIIDIKFPAPRAYLLGASVHISLIVFLLAPLPAFEQTPETGSGAPGETASLSTGSRGPGCLPDPRPPPVARAADPGETLEPEPARSLAAGGV